MQINLQMPKNILTLAKECDAMNDGFLPTEGFIGILQNVLPFPLSPKCIRVLQYALDPLNRGKVNYDSILSSFMRKDIMESMLKATIPFISMEMALLRSYLFYEGKAVDTIQEKIKGELKEFQMIDFYKFKLFAQNHLSIYSEYNLSKIYFQHFCYLRAKYVFAEQVKYLSYLILRYLRKEGKYMESISNILTSNEITKPTTKKKELPVALNKKLSKKALMKSPGGLPIVKKK